MVLLRQVLKGLALGFRNQQSREHAADHETPKDLHYMIEPFVGTALIAQWADQSLRYDRADFAGACRQSMGCGTESRGEDFSRNFDCVKTTQSTHSDKTYQ